MLDCKKIQGVLSEYVDGTLVEEESWAIKQHLRSCAVCGKIAEELSQTVRLLAFLPSAAPSESFEARLAARLANQSLRPKPLTPLDHVSAWWSRPRVRPAVASGVAVAALVPVAFLVLRPTRLASAEITTTTAPTPDRVVEGGTLDQVMQDHLSATTTEAFGNSSGLLLVSGRTEGETGS